MLLAEVSELTEIIDYSDVLQSIDSKLGDISSYLNSANLLLSDCKSFISDNLYIFVLGIFVVVSMIFIRDNIWS